MLSISFCTVAMNRLDHIKQTLRRNIEDNLDYLNSEFVLLDYNSSDGLQEWIQKEMPDYIKSGILKFYRTTTPPFFHRSHSRNMAFKLACGEILCNTDADNFVGKGFAKYLSEHFSEDPASVLTAIIFPHKNDQNVFANNNAYGRVVCRKKAFHRIRGYDERLASHGFEDYDIVNRLEISGEKRVLLDRTFLTSISHETKFRINNEAHSKKIDKILINFITPSSSKLIYLYVDNTLHMGIVRNQKSQDSENILYAYTEREFKNELTIDGETWENGYWDKIENNKYKIRTTQTTGELTIQVAPVTDQAYLDKNIFFQVSSPDMIYSLLLKNSQLANRQIMVSNWENRVTVVNKEGFGIGPYYKMNEMGTLDILNGSS